MTHLTRRALLAAGATSLATAALAQTGIATAPIGFDLSARELAHARAFLADHISVDAHAHPGMTFVRGAEHLSPRVQQFAQRGTFERQTIADMVAGGLTAASFAAVADFQTLDFTGTGLEQVREFEPGEAWASYKRQIGNLLDLGNAGLVYPVKSVADFAAARKAGKVGAFWTVEGGDFLEGKPERVAAAYADGIRSITLIHYRNNELGDTTTAKPRYNGLTAAGIAVVREMNRIGMLIDVAHASEATAFGIVRASSRPVMASHIHINSSKLSNPRFISPSLAAAVAKGGGGILGAWPAGIGITDMAGYLDRTLELIDAVGIDHVCMGTDMDANYKPVFDTYTKLPIYVAGLFKRGLNDTDVAKLIGGNFLRILTAVQGS